MCVRLFGACACACEYINHVECDTHTEITANNILVPAAWVFFQPFFLNKKAQKTAGRTTRSIYRPLLVRWSAPHFYKRAAFFICEPDPSLYELRFLCCGKLQSDTYVSDGHMESVIYHQEIMCCVRAQAGLTAHRLIYAHGNARKYARLPV